MTLEQYRNLMAKLDILDRALTTLHQKAIAIEMRLDRIEKVRQ